MVEYGNLSVVRKEIRKRYPKLDVAKGKDYYYWHSEDNQLALYLAGLESTGIYVYRAEDQSIEQWLKEAEEVMKEFQKSQNEAIRIPIFERFLTFKPKNYKLKIKKYKGYEPEEEEPDYNYGAVKKEFEIRDQEIQDLFFSEEKTKDCLRKFYEIYRPIIKLIDEKFLSERRQRIANDDDADLSYELASGKVDTEITKGYENAKEEIEKLKESFLGESKEKISKEIFKLMESYIKEKLKYYSFRKTKELIWATISLSDIEPKKKQKKLSDQLERIASAFMEKMKAEKGFFDLRELIGEKMKAFAGDAKEE